MHVHTDVSGYIHLTAHVYTHMYTCVHTYTYLPHTELHSFAVEEIIEGAHAVVLENHTGWRHANPQKPHYFTVSPEFGENS